MTIEYYYLIMSQQDLLQNEAIEEVFRERTSSYFSQNRKNDFWILISPNFIKNNELSLKIKKTNFYKQKKDSLITNNNSEFYTAIVSTNKEFITWITLRIGYFENIETFQDIKAPNPDYISNGISGKINTNLVNNSSELFTSNPKYIHPDLLINKYKKLLEVFYSV